MCPSISELSRSTGTLKAALSQPSLQPHRSEIQFTFKNDSKSTLFSFDDYPPEQPILVYHKGLDVTPQRLFSPQFIYLSSKYDLDFEQVTTQKSVRKSSQVTKFHSVTRSSIYLREKITQPSLTNIAQDKELTSFGTTNIKKVLDEEVPSAMCLPAEIVKRSFPERIKLVLEETDSISLFELPSKTVSKGSREAETVEKSNETYEYLTVGKGKNRKRISTEAQTVETILKTRHTMAPKTERQNSYAFASVWDMFDSYEKEANVGNSIIETSQEILALDKLYEKDGNIDDKVEEEQETKININIENLLNAACIMERVLANNNYNTQQENYKGILRYECGPLLCESYNYILNTLWTFTYYKIENRPVTEIAINTENTDIIAVGYGKIKYTENLTGVVCVWSIKNPTQPERFYEFQASVTTMAFSITDPNLLAIGFYNGDVKIVDISSYQIKIIARSSRKTSPSYQPVWEVKWYLDHGCESVMAINIDGSIDVFGQTKTKDFISYPLIKLCRVDNVEKNMIAEKNCDDIPIHKNVNCQVHCWHPTIPDIYFIGTTGGCIYKCSTNYFRSYINSFVAHRGPVNGIEFSKFSKQIFVTCGADWTVKIWKENIFHPLIILRTDMNPVLRVRFSPTHSTVIVAVSGSEIYVWNIKQKVDTATLVHDLAPKFGQLTTVKFTKNGRNIIVGDVNGKVHTRYLLGLFPPEGNQGRILDEAIHNNLLIHPYLMTHIEKKEKLQKFL